MGHPAGEAIRGATYAVILLTIVGSSTLVFLLERGWLSPIQALLFRNYPEPGPPEP
jgi:hypothetical protein